MVINRKESLLPWRERRVQRVRRSILVCNQDIVFACLMRFRQQGRLSWKSMGTRRQSLLRKRRKTRRERTSKEFSHRMHSPLQRRKQRGSRRCDGVMDRRRIRASQSGLRRLFLGRKRTHGVALSGVESGGVLAMGIITRGGLNRRRQQRRKLSINIKRMETHILELFLRVGDIFWS